ncbi:MULTISPECIES: hypothetical protein [Pseudomonadaceae]|uniref:Uncharacterized protein n=1 Tax=Pseudomonas denitrificans TaxID=43306 RepID=A0A9X7MW13_PSEDE|nr:MULTISPECIES: hypothetical protein [Pseudomonadaceae]OQR35315.1 hypothetical protein BWR15_15375 [Pseudomonas sp. T]MBD9514292.1 hypothetical protein [Pseudomonas sp. PDM22]MBD9632856.1 hypothetical protein [Pseudomonas sp. PDM19]MBD9683473.1 hypothetical protein [Pseudomonas sp. PDM20]QEY70707.1 hypothetical protein F1C79_03025 [Pseudomonas denitrificans (nom. rej.)]
MNKLTAMLLLMTLASSAQASDFCTGIGLFARAGALYRNEGKTEQQAIAAIHEGSAKLDADTQVIVRYFVRFGYHGNQTPDQASANAEQKCRQYEASSERRNAMN